MTYGVNSFFFNTPEMNLAEQLKTTIDQARPRLLQITDEKSAEKPAPGKWSKKEILGHLIDSAANNHQRFVRANFQDHLRFDGYVQDGWVALQDYQHADWSRLIELWYQYNWHLSIVISQIPASVLYQPRKEHNLHQIAFKTVPKEEPTTLAYFIEDYIGHLAHHLKQIIPDKYSVN